MPPTSSPACSNREFLNYGSRLHNLGSPKVALAKQLCRHETLLVGRTPWIAAGPPAGFSRQSNLITPHRKGPTSASAGTEGPPGRPTHNQLKSLYGYLLDTTLAAGSRQVEVATQRRMKRAARVLWWGGPPVRAMTLPLSRGALLL
jgi:hypothetical protein